MKKQKEILSDYPKGFWKRIKWETIDCWRDWVNFIGMAIVLAAAITIMVLNAIGEQKYYQETYEAAQKINGHR